MNLKNIEIKDCYGELVDITPQLKRYNDGQISETSDWLWGELYHQGDIGTASIAWIIEAHEIFLKLEEIDWNYLSFTYAIMKSIEDLEFINCPEWAKGKYRKIAKKTLEYGISKLPSKPNEFQQLSVLSLTCAITRNYDSYSLIEYAWGYEEKVMELDF